jgi:predicted exporter
VTLGYGSTLIGEAVDYAIYMIQARREYNDGTTGGTAAAGWQHWLRSGWPTYRLGLLTSVCGFVALLFSGFRDCSRWACSPSPACWPRPSPPAG